MGPANSWDALKPLATRMGAVVREHEILRFSAIVHGKDKAKAAEEVRREVLVWAQNRSGGRLPETAWAFEEFESLSGGRNSVASRISVGQTDIWAIRADDPDKTIPGRVWTTEVAVALAEDKPCTFTTRLLVSTPENDLRIEPHTPGFVQQVSERCVLTRGDADLNAEPWIIETTEGAERLVSILLDQKRLLPVFVLTVPERSDAPATLLIDAQSLSRAVLGIAIVVIVPAAFTWTITNRLGKQRSVFGGAVRAYLPGFDESSSPYSHRLVLAEILAEPKAAADTVAWMRSLAASESLKRTRLGADVLTFSAIRNAALQLKQTRLEHEGASDGQLLEAANQRIAALESGLASERDWSAAVLEETRQIEERARAAEIQLNGASFRVQQLLEQLKLRGEPRDTAISLPTSWSEFEDWCDRTLIGRVTLAPQARKNVRKSEFEDVGLAARCLIWLSGDYRERRLQGGAGSLRDFAVEPGIWNSLCGSDEFKINWQEQFHTVDWHIKNGGNTRQPPRCLRIYYFWDAVTQQVVVADMPGHRPSAAS
jgi:hypothetical protein